MAKVIILENMFVSSLQEEVNKRLEDIPEDKLIDIKFSGSITGSENTPYKSGRTEQYNVAMIIYKD